MNSIKPIWITDYIVAYGNTDKEFRLVAVKFKKKILWVKNLTERLLETDDCYIVSQTAAIFDREGNVITPNTEENLLKSIFPRSSYRFSIFSHGILYACIHSNVKLNLSDKVYTKLNKNLSFRALCELTRARFTRELTFEQCCLFRFFKRNHKFVWKKWYAWYYYAFHISKNGFLAAVGNFPSSYTARLLHKSTSRIGPNDTSVPLDFYSCEITFDDADDLLLGAYYKWTEPLRAVTYVSPMVASFCDRSFRDVNQEICNGWLPLYRNRQTWAEKGFRTFTSHFLQNIHDLKGVLRWLSQQSSEKYCLMQKDLSVIAKFFF